MKKIITIIIIILLLPALCFAGALQEKQKSCIAKKNGSAADPCSCQGTTYMFCYTGDFSADTDKACFTNGTASKDGTPNSAISVSANYLEWASTYDRLTWAISSDDGVSDSLGTVYFDYYAVSAVGDQEVFRVVGDATNDIYIRVSGTSDTVKCSHTGNGTAQTVNSTATVVADAWYRIGYSWDTANNKHSVSVVTKTTSAKGWEEDSEALEDWTTQPSALSAGDVVGAATGTVRMRDVIVLSTYQATDPNP